MIDQMFTDTVELLYKPTKMCVSLVLDRKIVVAFRWLKSPFGKIFVMEHGNHLIVVALIRVLVL